MRRAMPIEALLRWAVAEMGWQPGVDMGADGDMLDAHQSLSQTGVVERDGQLGAVIRTTHVGGWLHGSAPSDDARLVWDHIKGHGASLQLVRYHAWAKTRPDWKPRYRMRAEPDTAWEPEPRRDNERGPQLPRVVDWKPEGGPEGHPVVRLGSYEMQARAGKGRRYSWTEAVEMCPVVWRDSADMVLAHRTVYTMWWEAVARLDEALGPENARLREVVSAGFSAPQTPWNRAEQADLERIVTMAHRHKTLDMAG